MISITSAALCSPRTAQAWTLRRAYMTLLPWAFTLCSSMRLLAYLPTLWAIHSSGDTSQHSLLTWISWLGANLTMAAWLYENNAARANAAVIASLCNALMCVATIALIVGYRL